MLIFNEFEPGPLVRVRENYHVFRKFRPIRNQVYVEVLEQYHANYDKPEVIQNLIGYIESRKNERPST
jgi:hypothetical protein